MFDMLAGFGLIVFLASIYVLIISLTKVASKPTPKPGKDFDERGPYG